MKNDENSNICLNCGEEISKIYCSNCGQEKECHHRFHHLFTHFVYDFVHYDHSFWRTLKVLFISPGKLTVEYLSGKRRSFVSPFSLYIFISIFSFFIISFIPFSKAIEDRMKIDTSTLYGINFEDTEDIESFFRSNSIDRGTKEKNLYTGESVMQFSKKYKEKVQGTDHFIQGFTNNMSKILFIYMPLFAFWLWLFNLRRNPSFFANGIFTLHWFSFLLLTFTFVSIIIYFAIKYGFSKETLCYIIGGMFIWQIAYFLRASRVFYKTPVIRLLIKSGIILLINLFLVISLMIFYILWLAGELF